MVLVVGSTGELGSKICYRLAEKGIPIRALVRPTSAHRKLERLKAYGAVLVQGDLTDAASLEAACEGAHTVICTATAMGSAHTGANALQKIDHQGVMRLVELAKRAGVEHFIYISMIPNPTLDFPLQTIKGKVEQYIITSGIAYSILRPTFFMETWLPLSPAAQEFASRIAIYGSGGQPVRWISMRDVASLAVFCLQNASIWNSVVEMGGPEAISLNRIAEMFQEKSSQLLQIERIPLDILRKSFELARNPVRKSWLGLELSIASGVLQDQGASWSASQTRLTRVTDYFANLSFSSHIYIRTAQPRL